MLYKSWRIVPITIKATLISQSYCKVLLYKPERNPVVFTDISQRQTQEQSCQADGDARTTETHGASAAFPGG